MKPFSRVCAEIHLDYFSHNLDEIERLLSPNTKICAVIKADGYGHGAIPLARVLENRESVWGYAVATAEEAVSLCEAGLTKPILILGYIFEEDLDDVVSLGIRPTISSLEAARELSDAAARLERTVPIHIKVDTGMSRIGFSCTDETAGISADEIAEISSLPYLSVEGLFTHFATADMADKSYAAKQAERFFTMEKLLAGRGVDIPISHMANSAAILDLPQYQLDLVRAGIILYGLWPSDEVKRERIELKPIMTLKSHVVQVKSLPPGTPVSYGCTYRTAGEEKIATIPVGYGDGYPRTLSNTGCVLIHGHRAPICGRVCMDQFMVNVTDIPGVNPKDEVTLIGRDGEEEITLDQLAALSGRFNYEFACDIGKRVPRVYVGE